MPELVKVKMLTKGPNANYRIGDVVTVDAARAAILLKLKAAEKVGEVK